ncbi:TonB-dependent receptor [Herbaspirillum sp. alder98]|uniref:TonB-dependent receptor n=1 Tax=Herbaspirillum sp. alder98 TaxID=2913096 RepID=UPI001CD879DD|nr:TonB-dependent receptor [Herbaspirillum sp. alder98]MCA1324693.1 TonB-dependent receptor [Herbaspirillum sp. alder98]
MPSHHFNRPPSRKHLAIVIHLALGSLVTLGAVMPSTDAYAQVAASAPAMYRFDVPAGPLAGALNRLADQANVLLGAPGALTGGKASPGVQGALTLEAAFQAVLAGSGLQAVRQADGSWSVREAASGVQGNLPAVTVSGEKTAATDPYAGGQVTRGSRLGVLGYRDAMDTPFNTSGYTAELIENQQARSVVDVLQNDPSVVIGWPRDSYVDQFNVRGFNVLGEDFTYDGLFGVSPPGKVPVEIVERVEIVRGTSAFLRGITPMASIGGAINLVPKRAADTPLTRLTATYDATSNIGTHLDLGRRFGERNQFGLRVNAVYRDGNTVRSGSAKEMGTLAIGTDFRGDKVRLSFDAGFDTLDVKRGEYWYFLDSNSFAIPAAPDTRRNTSQQWNRVRTDTTYAMGRAEFDLAPQSTVWVAAGGQNNKLKAHLPEPIITSAAGDFTEYFQYRAQQRRSITGEAGLRTQFDTGSVRHTMSLSATALQQKVYGDRVFSGTVDSNLNNPVYVAQPDFFANPTTAQYLNNLPLQSKSNLNSVALADDISLFDGRLLVMGGVRHQSVDVKNFFRGRQLSAYDKSAVTAGAGVLFKAMDNLSLYASYMEALNQGPVAPTGTSNEGTIFAPYKSRQYELGVKYELGQRLMATVSAFQIARPNGQTNLQTLEYSLDGEQRNRGLEIGMSGEVVRGVRLLGGAMLLDARLTHTEGGLNEGKRATGAPRYNMRIGGEWDINDAPGLTLTSRVNHAAMQYVDSANLQSIPAWTTVDLGGRYNFRLKTGQAVTLRADIRNLFDKAYWASSIGTWLNSGAGRTLTLSAAIDF